MKRAQGGTRLGAGKLSPSPVLPQASIFFLPFRSPAPRHDGSSPRGRTCLLHQTGRSLSLGSGFLSFGMGAPEDRTCVFLSRLEGPSRLKPVPPREDRTPRLMSTPFRRWLPEGRGLCCPSANPWALMVSLGPPSFPDSLPVLGPGPAPGRPLMVTG